MISQSMEKILLVDDEKDIVECLDMNLRKKGIRQSLLMTELKP